MLFATSVFFLFITAKKEKVQKKIIQNEKILNEIESVTVRTEETVFRIWFMLNWYKNNCDCSVVVKECKFTYIEEIAFN